MPSRRAISLFDAPSANSASTSSSRAVSAMSASGSVRRRDSGHDEHVRLIVLADQLDPFTVGKDGREPVGEGGISHVDRQP